MDSHEYVPNDYAYAESKKISTHDFHAILFALISRADASNLARLRLAFPAEVAEIVARYHARGGQLPAGWHPPADPFAERYGKAPVTVRMHLAIRYQLNGGHMQVRVFAGEHEHAMGLAGILRFRPAEWEALATLLIAGNAAPDGPALTIFQESRFEEGEPVSMDDPEIKAAVADAIAQADADADSPEARELRQQIADAWNEEP